MSNKICSFLQSGAVVRVNLAFERHASKTYMRAMFEQFRDILYEAGYDDIAEVEKGGLYTATHSQVEKREKWCRVVFHVKMIDYGWNLIGSVGSMLTWVSCVAMCLR